MVSLPRNFPRCGVCSSKLVKNGKTSAGRTRWRCLACGASQVQDRVDITRRSQLERFHNWLLSPLPQHAQGGTGRSFRAQTAWCWNIAVPQPAPTGEVHEVVMLDGTYFQGWCVLIAYAHPFVLGWQWCDREKAIAWHQLLQALPAPGMAVIDGAGSLAAALATCWPDVPVQRCYFHIKAAIRRHVTLQPRLKAGQELSALTNALMTVSTPAQARAWLAQYTAWETRWDTFLKHRSYAGNHRPRPHGIPEYRTWWYTHRELRRARALYRRLIKTNTLFTWLTASPEGRALPRTTSPLEGGPNKAIKDLLRHHRGLPPHRATIAVDWLLNSMTEKPYQPWDLAQPEHWQPSRPRPEIIEPEPGPAWGTNFSWEDGNRLGQGWAGRSN